jgi:putative transposase
MLTQVHYNKGWVKTTCDEASLFSVDNLKYKLVYRRRLPHFQPPGAAMFVTFRLAGSLPQAVLASLAQQSDEIEAKLAKISDRDERSRQADLAHRWLFGKWDSALESVATGAMWLNDPRIAGMVFDAVMHRVNVFYELQACTIMPNHVHVVFTPQQKPDSKYHSVASIMHSLKGYTARAANKLLQREGVFWQHESYDHVVRDEVEMTRIIRYVVNNPVKAGLVQKAEDWTWTYPRL